MCWLLKLDKCAIVLLSSSLSTSFETKTSKTIYYSRDNMSNLLYTKEEKFYSGSAYMLK